MEENKMWNVPNILKFKKPEVESKEIEIKEVDTRVCLLYTSDAADE